MPLPTTLKELQAICEQRGLKYKGKNKETLKTMLSADITIVDVVNDDEIVIRKIVTFVMTHTRKIKLHGIT